MKIIRAADRARHDPPQQQRRGALLSRFAPDQLKAAKAAYYENLFQAAGDDRKARLELYDAMRSGNLAPDEVLSAVQPEADAPARFAAARAEGVAEGRRIERDMLAALVASPAVKGQEAMALKWMADNPGMTAEAVISLCKHVAEAPKTPSLAERMARFGNGGAALSLGPATGDTSRASSARAVERVNQARGFSSTEEAAAR